ncbi:MAG: PilZ domain-containing protein [Thermodesulfovibrionales bacterium]|nr:PilZ domain-containing protein [Thermodesulfovibrionales bacterium]
MSIPERKSRRKKIFQEISINIPGEASSNFKGVLLDISEEGLGLSTEYPLKPGQLIEIIMQEGIVTGTVMWTFKRNGLFRAGIYRNSIRKKSI